VVYHPRVPPFFGAPSFEVRALVARFPRPLGELSSPPALLAALRPGEPLPRETWRAVKTLLHRFGRRPSRSLRPGGVGRDAAALEFGDADRSSPRHRRSAGLTAHLTRVELQRRCSAARP
jgi:hypothetical protein